MASFSIGSFAATGNDTVRGQAFKPNVAGPNGSGGPGSASQAVIRTASFGYPTASVTARSNKIYIYSVELDDVDEIGQSANLAAESTTGGYSDGTGLFGTGAFYRKFSFTTGILNVSTKYYIYFDRDQYARVNVNNPYAGGNSYDTDLDDMDPDCLQFQVEMDTI